MPGFNAEEPDWSKGFADPEAQYPTITGEPDTNRLAQGSVQEFHPSLYKRQKLKQTKVPIATKPAMSSIPGSMYSDHGGDTVIVATDDEGGDIEEFVEKIEKRTTWDEPDPKSAGVTEYPYNHVHESESGHVIEIDDTPGNERLHTYHNSGTFEEIHPDGTKVTKVVKDNYEIIAGSDNVFISGAVNLTVEGSVRHLVKGDYHLEVEGDYSQKIHKNHYHKVGVRGEEAGGGNLEQEIVGNHSYNIQASQSGRIHKDVDTTIDGKENRIVGKNATLFVTGDGDSTSPTYEQGYTIITSQDMLVSSAKKMSLVTTSGIMALQSASNLNLKSASLMHIKSETTIDMDATTEVDVDSALINLN